MRVVGFVDDDSALRRRRIQGVPVVGTLERDRLGRSAATTPDTVLVTIPDAPRERLDGVVEACGRADVSCRFVRAQIDLDPRVVLGAVGRVSAVATRAARSRARTLADRLLAAVPLASIYLWLCIVYASRRGSASTPWLFTDELEMTQLSRSIAATGHAARRGEPHSFRSLYTVLTAPCWLDQRRRDRVLGRSSTSTSS